MLVIVGCGEGAPSSNPDGATPIDAFVDPLPCGVRTGQRGLTQRQMMHGGLQRTYLVYLPPNRNPTTALPLLYVHHGLFGDAQTMLDGTELAALADAEGIALIVPNGQAGPSSLGAPWNVGPDVCPSNAGPPPNAQADDLAFLDAMRIDVGRDQCIDAAHVFVTGFSMGGYFAHHAGCSRPDFAGVAPHSGGTHDLSKCASARKPIIIFHGLVDSTIPAGCNDPASPPVGARPPAALAWAQHNGCSTTTTSRAVQGGTCIRYDGCPAGGQVELCTFPELAHCWAGGAPSPFFTCTNFEDATTLAWQFWKTYAW